MDGIDWDEWIRSDADNINQLRGMRASGQHDIGGSYGTTEKQRHPRMVAHAHT